MDCQCLGEVEVCCVVMIAAAAVVVVVVVDVQSEFPVLSSDANSLAAVPKIEEVC